MMSSRASLAFEGTSAVPINLSLKTLFIHRLFNDIHLGPENSRQSSLEFIHAAEIIKAAPGKLVAEPHRDIDVVSGILSTGHGSE